MRRSLAPCLAVFGTASDVGKSTVVSALGRLLADRGIDVAPFKAQNMSNNSGVTRDGGEMGRAQLVQAAACRVEPHVDMNPVLLKPVADCRSQVVLLGRVLGEADAKSYFADTAPLKRAAFEALERLRERHSLVLIEGAGSCAEVNLRQKEFVNFPVAHAADAPVLLVADIDRGGVFAQVIGSLAVMPPEDRARVKALLVNRFRGDLSLFADGRSYLEKATGLPVVGVLPYQYGLRLESEDALPLDAIVDPPRAPRVRGGLSVAVLGLPHLANFTDFDVLGRVPGASVHYLYRPRELGDYDLLILPGSKAVRHDLAWLTEQGWPRLIQSYWARGGHLLGICGGYQMLGSSLSDSEGVEGEAGESPGLGLLRVRTRFGQRKLLSRTTAFAEPFLADVEGYEIHMGITESFEERPALSRVLQRPARSGDGAPGTEGALSPCGRVIGTYLHGLLDTPAAIAGLYRWLGHEPPTAAEPVSSASLREQALDGWARHFAEHVDLTTLFECTGIGPARGLGA